MQNTWISFSHFNVRSLCTGFDLFSDTLRESCFDVIGLSETWLNPALPDNGISISGYKIVRKDREGRGGGVAFYLKNSLKFSVVDVYNQNSPLEHLWISLKIAGKKVCLGTVYRPPNTNFNQCMDHLENILVSLLPEFDYVLFGGDFNVDFLSIGNYNLSLLKNLLNNYGLNQIINQPTRLTETSQTLIDIIVSSCPEIAANVEVINMEDISDHCMVNCSIKLIKPKQQILYRTYRDFSKFNYDLFLYDLQTIYWDYIYELDELDDIVDFFSDNVLCLFDIHAPQKTAKITKPPAPWLTDNLKLMMRLRSKALTRYKKLQTDEARSEYTNLRNLVNMSVKSEKKAYLQHAFKTDPKNFWRTLKYLNICSNTEKDSSSFSDISTPDNFNKFFVNDLPQINAVNQDLIEATYINKTLPDLPEQFSFKTVTAETVEKMLFKIKSNAVGPDGLSVKMLLYLTPYLSKHITFILNKCLLTGKFPNLWKNANVLPVPKNSSPSLLSHFRPISILPVMSKLLEKIVQEQLNEFLHTNKILSPTQSGFRGHHSTATALLNVTDDLFRASDNNKNTCLILLDYSKAFDTLEHTTLVTKLKFFGIGEVALMFFENYLNNRHQRVILNNVFSEFIALNKGVPQGSILGPLLFSIYTSDLCKRLNFCQSHQYADDTQIYHSFTYDQLGPAIANINSDLDVIGKFSNAHGLILNEGKTQVMVFGRSRNLIVNNPLFKIVLNNAVLEPVHSCKNLGVHIDVNLRFGTHVSSLIKKTFSKLKILYIYKDIFSTEVKLRLTNSLILSHLDYCNVVYWPALLQKDKDTLQKIQNACIRFSYNIRKFDHISGAFRESGWFNLHERFQIHLACLIYKIDNLKLPQYLQDKIVKGSDIHERGTRHRELLNIPRHNSAMFQRSFTYNSAKIFNIIPDDIKAASNLVSFRNKVKAFTINNRDLT